MFIALVLLMMALQLMVVEDLQTGARDGEALPLLIT
jgi:hypothetical protein